MARWVGEWMMLSMLLVLGMGLLLVFWTIWPLMSAQLPAAVLSITPEGLLALLLLAVIGVGFGKLLAGR